MTDGNLREAFLSLRGEFLEITQGRIAVIERNWPEVFSPSGESDTGETLELIKREAHTIAGSSGTYGYATVFRAAKNLEVFCAALLDEGADGMDDARQAEFTATVTSLLEESSRMFADPEIGTMPF